MTDVPGTITERQMTFLLDLLETRNLLASPKWFDAVNAMDEGEYAACLNHLKTVTVPALSKHKASAYIKQLLKLPKNQNQSKTTTAAGPWKVEDINTFAQMGQASAPGEELFAMHRMNGIEEIIVPRGSYAIERSTLRFPQAFTNDILFFSVWIDDEPMPDGSIKWSVKMYVSDERVKISRSLQYDVLDAIGQAPATAATRYGLEKKRCGICSRKLTNDESRARGIGPVCAEKWGW